MKLTILGSGTSYINFNRFASGYLIEHNSTKILIDCGEHISRRLLERNLSLFDIDHVIITHSHPDHIGDLIPMILSMSVENRYFEKTRKKPLYLHGYPRFSKDYNTLCDIMLPDRSEPYEIIVKDHSEGQFHIDELKITTTVVPHMPQFMQTIAIRIDQPQGGSLTYSGDTGFSRKLIDMAKKSDVLICEAAFSTRSYQAKGEIAGHMAPQEAGKTAQAASVKKLILSHVYDGLEKPEEIIKTAGNQFAGKVILASDGMEIEL